jgi:hypothetical protein
LISGRKLEAYTEQAQTCQVPQLSTKPSQNPLSSDFAWLLNISEHEDKNDPYHSVCLVAIIQIREALARQRASVSVEVLKEA